MPDSAYCCILFVFYIKPQHTSRTGGAPVGCILFVFYIKPQRSCWSSVRYIRCILFVFYIKPQRNPFPIVRYAVVSYSCSTSNHNNTCFYSLNVVLYLIRVLHQTTTHLQLSILYNCCILFVFYIKPQHDRCIFPKSTVVSYSCSTSNHNSRAK